MPSFDTDDKAGVDKALKKAKSTLLKIVKAKNAKVTGLKVTFKKLKATVKWKKTKGVTGYKVVYKLKTANQIYKQSNISY